MAIGPVVDGPDGAVVAVRAMPRAGRSGVDGLRNGALLVRLQAAPVDGAANAELVRVLADVLDVPVRSLTIASGATGRTKRVRVAGLSAAEAARRLGV